MFNFGKNILSGFKRLFSGKKPEFSRRNIERYIPEPLKKPAKPQKKGFSTMLISAITIGIGVVGVIAGIGVSKLVRERRIKKAVVLVGENGADMGSKGFNGYLLKYTDLQSLDNMLDTLAANGFNEIIIVPMTLINGYETEKIRNIISFKREFFEKITCSNAMLTTDGDYDKVAKTLIACTGGTDEDTAVVFVGSGTTHYSNSSYIALNERFRQLGCYNLFVGTASSYPGISKVMDEVSAAHYQNVILCPLEITVSDELKADIADGENSWYEQFMAAGFNCGCYMKGLCSYKGIRQLIVEHTRSVMAG